MGMSTRVRRASSAPAPAVGERTRRRETGSDLDGAVTPALSLLESLEIRRVSLFPRPRRVGGHAPRRRESGGARRAAISLPLRAEEPGGHCSSHAGWSKSIITCPNFCRKSHIFLFRVMGTHAQGLKRSNSARRATVISRAPAGCNSCSRSEGDKIPRHRRLGGRPRALSRRIPIRARLIRTSHQLTHVTMAAIASAASVAPQVRAAPSRASVPPSSVPLVLRAGARASSDSI